MSSVWFADISMESLPGPRPVRPTVSLRPSMACFRQQSARLVDMHALKPCARSCFSLPENLTSPRSTRMPAEPHYPLSFQKSPKSFGYFALDLWFNATNHIDGNSSGISNLCQRPTRRHDL